MGATCLRSAPAATSWSLTRVDVFYRGCNDRIYHHWKEGTGSWNGEDLGGCTKSAPAAAASSPPNRIDLFFRNCTNNGLYQKWYATGWSQPVDVSGATCMRSGPGAVWIAGSPGRLDVVYRGCNDATYHHWKIGTGSWSGESLGGCTMLAPSITSRGSSNREVFSRGCGPAPDPAIGRPSGEGIYRNSQNGSSWSGWTNLEGCLASGQGAEGDAPDDLDVIYRTCNSPPQLAEAYWNGGTWTHLILTSWP